MTKLRNPNWTRDELIVALDIYLRYDYAKLSIRNPVIVETSEVLTKLGKRLGRIENEKFRNPSGVYMKLGNLRRYDPTYTGKGLSRGNKIEKEVWESFGKDPTTLKTLASSIRETVENKNIDLAAFADEDEELSFPEGAIAYRLHVSRERNRKLVALAKQRAIRKLGRLACEVCGFDFSAFYGELGKDFIECHHLMGVSNLRPGSKTRVEDVALLCANCHRMIHRRRPLLAIEELRLLIEASKTI